MSLCLVVICRVTMSCSELCQCGQPGGLSVYRAVQSGGGCIHLQIRLLGVKLQAECRNAYRVACHLD